jgi:uncharacterized protein (DUF1778 family)
MSSQSDAPPARVRSERLVARVDTEQKRLFQHAANLQGRTLSDFLIASAQEAAQRTIDRQAMVLDALDSAAFVAGLLDPPPVNDRLRESFRRHARLSRRAERS